MQLQTQCRIRFFSFIWENAQIRHVFLSESFLELHKVKCMKEDQKSEELPAAPQNAALRLRRVPASPLDLKAQS